MTIDGRRSLARSLLLAAALAMPLMMMTGKSITSDENVHISAGLSYLKTRQITLNPMHPPLLKELCALPLLLMNVGLPADARTIAESGKPNIFYQWKFADDFVAQVDLKRVLFWARVPAVLLSFALAVLIARWAGELWGPSGELVALFCYVLDPTIVAHAQFVTTDLGFAFFATLFVYRLRKLLIQWTVARAAIAGLCLGLALGAKFTGIVLVPVAVLLVAARVLIGGLERLAESLIGLAVMAAVAASVVWTVYFFPSDALFYLRGYQSIYGDKNFDYFYFFHGEFSQRTWPSYFLVASLIKTPLPTLIALVVAIGAFVVGPRRSWIDEACVLVPLVALFTAATLFAQPIGIRYVIPCFPFAFLFAGRVGPYLAARTASARALLALFVVWQSIEFFSIWPDHLSYFNQLVGGWRGGTAWLDDSSLDWGQNFPALRDYLDRNPRPNIRFCNFITPLNAERYGIHATLIDVDKALVPRPPETLVLSAHCLARARARLAQKFGDSAMNWLAHEAPAAIVAHTYYVYDLGRDSASDRE